MATNTPKLNLVKPEMSDYADIRVLNGNMDILDKEIGGLDYVKNVVKSDSGLTFTKKDDTEIQVPLNYMPTTGGNFTGDITVKNKEVVTIVDSWYDEDATQYWIKYSDGQLIQQLFILNEVTTPGKYMKVVTLSTPFIDTNYHVSFVGEAKSTHYPVENNGYSPTICGKTNTNTTAGCTAKTNTNVSVMFDTWADVNMLCVGRWK